MKDSPATVLGLIAIILGLFIWRNGWEDGLLVVAVALPMVVIVGTIRIYREKRRGRK